MYGSDEPGIGLSEAEARRRLETFGPNVLEAARGPSWFGILLRQFTSVLIVILLIAALVAAIMGETVDAVAIVAIVVLNGALGFFQEWRAERTLEALRGLLAEHATVIRDGKAREIDMWEIVPGDHVLLQAGAKVPADIRLVDAAALRADESALTGESVSADKGPGEGRSGSVFMGTNIVEGRGSGTVVATGMKTDFGDIASATGRIERRPTHLQQTLARLGTWLGLVALVLGALVVILGVLVGHSMADMAMTGLSLAVAMVPEGLPAVVTVTLALGARAMVRRKALSRRLQATETLGAASIVCTDKTGTLTENRMTVSRIWTPEGTVDVSGVGYAPSGSFTQEGRALDPGVTTILERLLWAARTCNHAKIERCEETWERVGEPTEAALVVAAMKAGVEGSGRTIREIPFSSERKRMTVVADTGDGPRAFVKGAPERILERCAMIAGSDGDMPLDDARRADIERAYESFAERGHRVLAVAERPVFDASVADDRIESDLVFLGLVGIIDPPRAEVKDAIEQARGAGIDVVMITGDAPVTALAIARMIGIPAHGFVTGDELESMDDNALSAALDQGVVFARTTPRHKMRIVEILQRDGRIVAMTGDGVNDAPALKKADIGIAMGIRGTDVARDASDLVLLDDNFASIVGAIEEGRRQYANIRKFVRYLLSSNAGEVVAIGANIVIGGPLIFLPIQILWMNLVTDGITALALGFEKSEPDAMKQAPRAAEEDVIGRRGLAVIATFALYTGTATLFAFYHTLDHGPLLAGTVAFTTMVFLEKFSVFAFRSLTAPLSSIGFLSNPWLLAALGLTLGLQVLGVHWAPLQHVLHTTALPRELWALILLLVLPVVIVPEAYKIISSRNGKRGQAADAP